jgi:hypothetical protein
MADRGRSSAGAVGAIGGGGGVGGVGNGVGAAPRLLLLPLPTPGRTEMAREISLKYTLKV